MNLGGEISFDPMDGDDPVTIQIYSSPDELTREWTHAQPSVVSVPEGYLDQYGKRRSVRNPS